MSTMRLRSTSTSKKNKDCMVTDQEVKLDKATQENSLTSEVVVNEESRMRKVLVRTAMGCCMVVFYCSMLRGGYMYCILVGVLTQVLIRCAVQLLNVPSV